MVDRIQDVPVTTGEVYKDAKKAIKELKDWAREQGSKLTIDNLTEKIGHLSLNLYELGKGGLKRVGGDISNLLDYVELFPEEDPTKLTLEDAMDKKIIFNRGQQGDNVAIGSKTDIKSRNELLAKNSYNSNKGYSSLSPNALSDMDDKGNKEWAESCQNLCQR